MRAINLLPSDSARGHSLPSPAVVAATAAPVVAAGLVLMGYALEHSSVISKRSQLASLSAQVAALPKVKATPNAPAINLVSQEASARMAALDAALADRVPWDTMLNQVAEVVPSDVWLTSLGLTSPVTPGSTSTAPTNGLTAAGYTDSQDSLAHLLQRLSLLPGITNVTLSSDSGPSSSSGTTASSPSLVAFEVTATIKPPSSPSTTPTSTPSAGTPDTSTTPGTP